MTWLLYLISVLFSKYLISVLFGKPTLHLEVMQALLVQLELELE
nr:hypothetical protein Q903MT_gene6511 [Picea sitchensis]